MGTEGVIKYGFLVGLMLIFSNSGNAQDNSAVYIKSNNSEIIILDENYMERLETDSMVIFSFGLDSLGEINDFVYDKKGEGAQKIGIEEGDRLPYHTIGALNKRLMKAGLYDRPNVLFEKIFIVEKDEGSYSLYPVFWKKKIFEE